MSEIHHEIPPQKYPNRETAAMAKSIIGELGADVKDILDVVLDKDRGIIIKGITQEQFNELVGNPGFAEKLKNKAKGAQYAGSLELHFEPSEK